MKTLLTFDPAVFLETARALRVLAHEALENRSALDQQWSRLDAGWQSYARENVEAHQRICNRKLITAHDMLQQSAITLLAALNKLTHADARAASLFRKTTPPAA